MAPHSERMAPSTVATRIYKQIKEDILDGVFAPGAHPARRTLAEKLDPANHELKILFQKHHSDFHNKIARLSGAKLIYQQMKKVWYRRLMVVCNVIAPCSPAPRIGMCS